jgi:hypothetical protein
MGLPGYLIAMSEQPPTPDPVAPATLPEVVFRMFTPIFRYAIDGARCFTHCGNHGNARFEIELRPYAHNPTDWAQVTQYADDGIRDLLVRRRFHLSDHFCCAARHCLLTDVIHPESSVSNVAGGTVEGLAVHQAAVDALRLHSSAGLPYHDTYEFRSPPPLHPGLGTQTPNTRQSRFTHLGEPSVLRSKDFHTCRSTINCLLNKTWTDSSTFDKVLRLAMEYHRLAFTLERVEHPFLILMVAFEAMFKKKDEDNASRASQRIGRLLGTTKAECMSIHKEFFDNKGEWFSQIRNDIGHGDTSLSLTTVAGKYPSLYRHVTAAIVRLLNLPLGSMDDSKDYYDEISRLADTRFFSLPNS